MKFKARLLHTARNFSAKIPAATTVVGIAALSSSPAFAEGLEAGTTLVTNFKSWAWVIGPLIASIGGLFTFLGYSIGFIQKDHLVRWVVGIIGTGMVGGIVSMAMASGAG